MEDKPRFISVDELERRVAALEKTVANMNAPADIEKIAKELYRLQSASNGRRRENEDDHDLMFEIHDIVYIVVIDEDFQKRIGFKKWFIDDQLRGIPHYFKPVMEEWGEELRELDRFTYHDMCVTLYKVLENNGIGRTGVHTYNSVGHFVYDKVKNMRLDAEVRLLAEARGHLFAYEDFILGLKQNQYLYDYQKQQYNERLAELRTAFDDKMSLLMSAAARVGLLEALQNELDGAGISERDTLFIESQTMKDRKGAGQ